MENFINANLQIRRFSQRQKTVTVVDIIKLLQYMY